MGCGTAAAVWEGTDSSMQERSRHSVAECRDLRRKVQINLPQIFSVAGIGLRIGIEWDGSRTAVRIGHLRTSICSACAHGST